MKIKTVFIAFFILFFGFAYGQNYKKLNELRQQVYIAPKDTQAVIDLYKYVLDEKNNVAADSVNEYLKFLFDASSKIPFHRIEGHIGSKLGNYYNGTGDYTKALFYLFEAEKAYSVVKNYKRLSAVYSLIGNTYMGLNNKPEQKKYFSRSYDLAVEHNLKQEIAHGAIGMASYYGSVKSFDEAIKWNDIAVEIFKEIKNYVGVCIALSNGAGYYIEIKNLKKAKQKLDLAEENLPLAKSNYASFVCYQGQGGLNELEKNYAKAMEYFKKCLDLMIEDKAMHNISEAYKRLAETAYNARLYKESADYMILHIQYRDSVFNETANKQLLEVQEKYETEKKNAQIQLLNAENDFNKSEINRKMILIYAGIAVTALLLVFFVFVIRSNVQKNKSNKLLENQKVIIETKQKEILDSIYYAERIQKTLLPNEKYIEKSINNLKGK